MKIYVGVFMALLVGTIITVGLYYVHFESTAMAVAVALFIASIKAFLVAGFFMHLISERRPSTPSWPSRCSSSCR